jgi:hypothetical protein
VGAPGETTSPLLLPKAQGSDAPHANDDKGGDHPLSSSGALPSEALPGKLVPSPSTPTRFKHLPVERGTVDAVNVEASNSAAMKPEDLLSQIYNTFDPDRWHKIGDLHEEAMKQCVQYGLKPEDVSFIMIYNWFQKHRKG